MKRRVNYLYLQYVNNFLTLKAFAEYYQLSNAKALQVIKLGRKIVEIETSKGVLGGK